MATYKFPQFNVEIVNPTISVQVVHDYIQQKECTVEVSLVTSTTTFGVLLTGFTYVSDWNDTEVEMWTLVELQKYEVPTT